MATNKYFLIIVLSAIGEISLGQTWANGYYISGQNDSVLTTIKIPTPLFQGFDPQRLQHKVKTKIDDSSAFQTFKPSEVKGFGFVYKNERYKFVSITLDDRRRSFFRMIYSGNHVAGYYSYSIGYRGSSIVAVRKQVDGGETLLLKSSSMSKRKIKLKLLDFYKYDSKAKDVIQNYQFSLKNLPESVKILLEKIAETDPEQSMASN